MTSKSILFNDNWQFCLTELDEIKDLSELLSRHWFNVELPHDWLIGDAGNLYKSGDGWYRKIFSVCAEELSGRVFLNFDGVYTNSVVFINGKEAGAWTYGYSAFEFDITDFLFEGKNEILVKVHHQSPNTRWYSGAGIYRDVVLKTKPLTHLRTNGIYIHSEKQPDGSFLTEVETDVCGEAGEVTLAFQVFDGNGVPIAGFKQDATLSGGEETFSNSFTMESPELWDIDSPNLYMLTVSLSEKDGAPLDEQSVCFGYKTAEFVPEKGLVLNGRQIKLHGVCMHHDLGALGAAYNEDALYRQLLIMKKMGANAIRTSHNPPSKQFMDICDKLGLLVDSECFDMWENPKTEFDNARFFVEHAERDVKSWIERDRNHASLLMWSIGNEISDTNAPHGIEITKRLFGYVNKYDPKKNAPATIGSNFMGSENAQKCSDVLKIAGYNYTERMYREHHAKYPDWTIYGSETASAVRSRGIYRFPADLPLLTHEDMQCSSLDNSFVGWGCTARKAWKWDRDTDFCAGQFIWTGFDYIGEPTPYSTKNSYFGIVDTAGFPKDIYYFYQSVWLDPETHPMLHIAPSYWDFNPGQDVDVIIYSNAERVELFLNGKSLGVREMRLSDSDEMRAHFVVPFERGILSAKGYGKDGKVIAVDTLQSFGDPKRVVIGAPLEKELHDGEPCADGRSVIFAEISVTDESGVPVGNARNRIKVEVSGAGRLVGLDNGDSTDYDSFKGDNKRLFSGKLLAMVETTLEAGDIVIRASSKGLQSAELCVKSVKAFEDVSKSGVSVVTANAFPAVTNEYTPEIPVRKIELSGGGELNAENKTAFVSAKLFPANATYKDVTWKAVRPNGVEIGFAEVTPAEGGAVVTAIGDGEFLARAFVNNGGGIPQVCADVPFTATGLGAATKNPYEFVSASQLDGSNVTVSVIEDGAVSNFDGRTVMTYNAVDFGATGTEKLVLHIGACFDMAAEIWDGTPENGELLITAAFGSNGHWCGFAPQEFHLGKRLSGVHDISVVIDSRVIFGGFSFEPINRAFDENFTAESDSIYGDDYKINGRSVVSIGNNVIINYDGMDFGEKGAHALVITGATPNPTNPVQLRYTPAGGEQNSVFLNFAHSDSPVSQRFDIPELCGANDISFVFLPGTKFDFISFRFE